MKRSRTYYGTFPNTETGISAYVAFRKSVRQRIKGGRFMKFFRGYTGNQKYGATNPRDGSTHFDVYILGRWDGGARSVPVDLSTGQELQLW